MGEQSASTAAFVARLNIEHFKKKLAAETDESERKHLLRLLADEEAKLAELEKANDGEERA